MIGLPVINFPSDMKAAVDRLAQTARGTDEGVRACGALDLATRAAWGDFYIGLTDFTNANANPGLLDLTSTLMGRLQSYGTQLFDWQQKLGGTCKLGAPPFNPNPPAGAASAAQNALDTVASIAKWGAIAAIVVGSAVVVGKAIELVPHKQLAK